MSFRRIEKLHWQTALTENLIIEMYDTWSNLEPGLFVINDSHVEWKMERTRDQRTAIIFHLSLSFFFLQ